VRALARRSPLIAYLLMSYLWAIVVFAFPVLAETGIGLIPVSLPGVAPFVAVTAIGLALAGGLVSRWNGGAEGSAAYRRRVFRFRADPWWYPIALLVLPMTAVVVSLVAGFDAIDELTGQPSLLVGILGGSLVAFLLVNWWEEAGWTGFVLDGLQGTMGPVRASVVTTWLQAGIHLPLLLVAGGVTEGRVPTDQIPLYLVLLFVLPIPVRILITWVYNTTGRSVPIVGILHAGLGTATGSALLSVIAPGMESLWVYGGFACLAVIVLASTKGRLGYPVEPTRIG
jgi:membrane protease YdiL (CAAX protease family)